LTCMRHEHAGCIVGTSEVPQITDRTAAAVEALATSAVGERCYGVTRRTSVASRLSIERPASPVCG
jgi:hypothetical protein